MKHSKLKQAKKYSFHCSFFYWSQIFLRRIC